ncbi:hypothetical protein GW17_00047387 [Ensete ventricosum]|nr:hypothetical protein GW17_00047387 [Ensete ventricosum]
MDAPRDDHRLSENMNGNSCGALLSLPAESHCHHCHSRATAHKQQLCKTTDAPNIATAFPPLPQPPISCFMLPLTLCEEPLAEVMCKVDGC